MEYEEKHTYDNSFHFSKLLRKQIEKRLIERILEVCEEDSGAMLSYIEYGFGGIKNVCAYELADLYMDWFGVYSPEENPDDYVFRKMIEEINGDRFEKEVLDEAKTISNSDNSI